VFATTSRYAAIPISKLTVDGREITYVRRRFLPPVEHFALLIEHRTKQGERVDTIAAEHLGDPEQYWRICDANGVVDPLELTETGKRVRITLPEGVPAPRNA